MQEDIVFKFSRPSGAPRRTPSKAMTDALRQLGHADEMRPLIADARNRRRKVVLQVFHWLPSTSRKNGDIRI
jgi:hypothetical protein